MAKTVNVDRVFEAVARIVTQREEGAQVTLVEVRRIEDWEAAAGERQQAVRVAAG